MWFELKGQVSYSFLECDMEGQRNMRCRELRVALERGDTARCLEGPADFEDLLVWWTMGFVGILTTDSQSPIKDPWAGLLLREGRQVASPQERRFDKTYVERGILSGSAHFQCEGEAHVHSRAERLT